MLPTALPARHPISVLWKLVKLRRTTVRGRSAKKFGFVGQTPWSARVPWTRFQRRRNQFQDRPTRASAAVQGDRPTINAAATIGLQPQPQTQLDVTRLNDRRRQL